MVCKASYETPKQSVHSLSVTALKVQDGCLRKTCHEIIEPKLDDAKCVFRGGFIITEQMFTLQKIMGKSWGFTKYIYACFVLSILIRQWLQGMRPCCSWKALGSVAGKPCRSPSTGHQVIVFLLGSLCPCLFSLTILLNSLFGSSKKPALKTANFKPVAIHS